jgi:cobalt-zinc-cadmium efflux system outer membrane protein
MSDRWFSRRWRVYALHAGVCWVAIAAPAGGAAANAGPRAETLAAAMPVPLPLDWCLATAREGNPDVAAQEAEREAAVQRIRPAGSLEDPRIGYAASNIPVQEWDFDSSAISGNQLDLRQKVPFPGLLSSRRAAAQAGAAAAAENLADRERTVAAEAERRWAALAFAQRALDITDANLDLLRQLTEVAEAKYRVGTGLQQDVIRAQVELTVLLEERLRRVAAIHTAEARLAALLDLPPGTSFPRTTELRDTSTLPELPPLLERLPETSPLLRALSQRVEEAERSQRAVELESYPDFDVVVGYRIRSAAPGDPVAGQDLFTGGLSIRLPVDRGKWRARVAEQAALVRRARAHYRSGLARLGDAVRSAFADLERADAETALLETGLIPQARQSLASNRSAYQVDKVDFLSLIDSQTRLLDAELSLVRATADRRAAFAALEGAVGEVLR